MPINCDGNPLIRYTQLSCGRFDNAQVGLMRYEKTDGVRRYVIRLQRLCASLHQSSDSELEYARSMHVQVRGVLGWRTQYVGICSISVQVSGVYAGSASTDHDRRAGTITKENTG